MTPSRLLPILLAAAMLPGGAHAGINEGLALYAAGNYGAALHELQPLAERGDARAQWTLARMYLTGQGVRPDIAAGIEWDRKAAEQGVVEAQVEIAMRSEYGIDMPQDLAAAARWYRAAADRNSPIAQFRLGLLYVGGRGVPKDPLAAHMWLNLAAAQMPAGDARNVVVRERDAVGDKLTVEQMREAQARAREWRPVGRPVGSAR